MTLTFQATSQATAPHPHRQGEYLQEKYQRREENRSWMIDRYLPRWRKEKNMNLATNLLLRVKSAFQIKGQKEKKKELPISDKATASKTDDEQEHDSTSPRTPEVKRDREMQSESTKKAISNVHHRRQKDKMEAKEKYNAS